MAPLRTHLCYPRTWNHLVIPFNTVPGGGKRPHTIWMDLYSKELSFPNLFPSGEFGNSCYPPKEIDMRITSRVGCSTVVENLQKNFDYLFYAQYWCEAKEVKDSLSVSLQNHRKPWLQRKWRKICLMSHAMIGAVTFSRKPVAFQYFRHALYDLLGMIGQHGPCTWFITVSAADLTHWGRDKMAAIFLLFSDVSMVSI